MYVFASDGGALPGAHEAPQLGTAARVLYLEAYGLTEAVEAAVEEY